MIYSTMPWSFRFDENRGEGRPKNVPLPLVFLLLVPPYPALRGVRQKDFAYEQ